MALTMVACITGSVFFPNANFMPGANGKGGDGRKDFRWSVCESTHEEGTVDNNNQR
jgi:hypothetical protein